jgi:hypothetical protein
MYVTFVEQFAECLKYEHFFFQVLDEMWAKVIPNFKCGALLNQDTVMC